MSPTVWFLTGNTGKLAEANNHLINLYNVRQLIVENDQLYEPQAATLEIVAESKINQAIGHLPTNSLMVI